jgi:UPF0755 protein
VLARRLILAGAAAVVALALLGVGAVVWIVRGLDVPARPGGADRSFTVKPGEALSVVARRLERASLLPDRFGFGPRVLVAYARLNGLDRQVKTGEYLLSPALTPREILAKLCSGEVQTYAVTLPEGLNVWEVAQRVEKAGIVPADAFLELALSPEFAGKLGIKGDSLEGYLYPETYRFERGSSPEAVLRAMVDAFNAGFTEADRARLESSGRSLHEVVTLASIVEKETGAADERSRVAAVFVNRLKRGMRLQTDPTIIYGLMLRQGGAFSGNIRKVDLEADGEYNTYTRAGLPPGPIASVSMDSVRAVLEPADVSFLYFVSRNDGTHQFSTSLDEHNKAVDTYQRRRRAAPVPARPRAPQPGEESSFSATATRGE